MSKELSNSETAQALMRAFAGECQARSRYDMAASVCRKQGLPVLELVFQFTARQEQAHAKIFLEHLKALSGQSVAVEGTYPVTVSDDPAALLRAAGHNEYEEHDLYPAFGETAAREGFPAVAASFRQIAAIEQIHGRRFEALLTQLEAGTLFVSDVETGWMCLNCGHIHQGTEAPQVCPVCRHGQGWSIRLELAPWSSPALLR